MGELCNLVLNGFNNSRVRVTDGHHANTATHVNKLIAVHILHDRAVGVVKKDWQGSANTGSDYLLAALLHLGGKWTWNCGYEDSLLLKAHVPILISRRDCWPSFTQN